VQIAQSLLFIRMNCRVLYGGDFVMKKSNLERTMTLFLGHIVNKGASEEEIEIIRKSIYLIRKYLPFYKQQKES